LTELVEIFNDSFHDFPLKIVVSRVNLFQFFFSPLIKIYPVTIINVFQAEENPVIDPKHEKNATAPGLSHEQTLKLQPIRVAELCLRSAYLHRGNALAALGREEEARESYMKVMPMLDPEPRCGRLDWERVSVLVNVGNTYSRQGDYEKANEQYIITETLGREHLVAQKGNEIDGMGIVICAMRARAFALKKTGKKMKERKF